MLFLGLITYLVAIPFSSYSVTPSLFTRITSILLLFSSFLAFHGCYVESLGTGVGIYSGLFHVNQISLGMEGFLLFTGSILLLSWAPQSSVTYGSYREINSTRHAQKKPQKDYNFVSTVPTLEYGLLIVFTTMGACFLVSSSDLVSMYLSIELQSFAVYILATLYRTSESATSAGLKYFLLGGLSSALILLGTAIIYSYTGLTQFESIYSLCQAAVASGTWTQPVLLGLVFIGVGLLFKVASAPFHNWAPDVYDGVPTVVTSWLTTIPKISLFLFLLELTNGLEGSFSFQATAASYPYNVWKNLLLLASLLSLILGTVVGLSQYRIKRLLAYSTISHVGFLLLCLAINTEDSIESFLFYLIQYSLTNVATFLILLAFSYEVSAFATKNKQNNKQNKDINFIKELSGQFQENPILSASLAICLFSIAGIPPLLGFFAKQMVLYSSVHQGYYFLSLIAIVVSVISASYYLKIVRVLYFDTRLMNNSTSLALENVSTSALSTTSMPTTENSGVTWNANANPLQKKISTLHSFLIASLIMLVTFFILHPGILLNSCHLMTLSLFTY